MLPIGTKIPLFGECKNAVGNAECGDVLKGKTFSNSKANGLVGTIPVNEDLIVGYSNEIQMYEEGYYKSVIVVADEGTYKKGDVITSDKIEFLPPKLEHTLKVSYDNSSPFCVDKNGNVFVLLNEQIYKNGSEYCKISGLDDTIDRNLCVNSNYIVVAFKKRKRDYYTFVIIDLKTHKVEVSDLSQNDYLNKTGVMAQCFLDEDNTFYCIFDSKFYVCKIPKLEFEEYSLNKIDVSSLTFRYDKTNDLQIVAGTSDGKIYSIDNKTFKPKFIFQIEDNRNYDNVWYVDYYKNHYYGVCPTNPVTSDTGETFKCSKTKFVLGKNIIIIVNNETSIEFKKIHCSETEENDFQKIEFGEVVVGLKYTNGDYFAIITKNNIYTYKIIGDQIKIKG